VPLHGVGGHAGKFSLEGKMYLWGWKIKMAMDGTSMSPWMVKKQTPLLHTLSILAVNGAMDGTSNVTVDGESNMTPTTRCNIYTFHPCRIWIFSCLHYIEMCTRRFLTLNSSAIERVPCAQYDVGSKPYMLARNWYEVLVVHAT
jgi:hypothetical protein